MGARLTRTPLDPERERRGVRRPGIGGEVLFVGTVRDDPTPGGGRVRALEYEAYLPLARKELARLEREARRRFGRLEVRIVHRVGRVPVGAPSVVVAVGAPHRAEAFAACRFLIDRLKSEVPIWKSAERGSAVATRSGSPRRRRPSPAARRAAG